MLFNSSQISLKVVLLVVLGINTKVDFILAHECYVCGPKATISCDNFDPTNKSYIKDCPSAKGCSIQTYGNLVERSCEDFGLRDCKVANKIQYCYCSEKLCNGKTINFHDDEDLAEEGSGISVITTNTIQKSINEVNKENVTGHSNIAFLNHSALIPILIILYN